MKHSICIICRKKHMAKGFCKSHYNAFVRKNVDANGEPKNGYYFDSNFYLRKIKSTLGQTIRESGWYRAWVTSVIVSAGRRCEKCSKSGCRLFAHHANERFSTILNAAKLLPNIEEQIEYCKSRHTPEVGMCLCRSCHAEEHKGEKVYERMLGKGSVIDCYVCGEEVYCKGFCLKHYPQYRSGIYDKRGQKIRLLKGELGHGNCIVCGDISKGEHGRSRNFCILHLGQFNQGIIDENGNPLREIKCFVHSENCKICNEPYYGKGFCSTHYNRYKIGQIDINGQEKRPLTNSCRYLTVNGETHSVSEWAKRIGITRRSLYKRILKWGVEEALTRPRDESAIRRV